MHVLHVTVVFSVGYTNTVIFWRGTKKKCKVEIRNKQKQNAGGIGSFYMQNTNPTSGPTVVVEHVAIDTALSQLSFTTEANSSWHKEHFLN